MFYVYGCEELTGVLYIYLALLLALQICHASHNKLLLVMINPADILI